MQCASGSPQDGGVTQAHDLRCNQAKRPLPSPPPLRGRGRFTSARIEETFTRLLCGASLCSVRRHFTTHHRELVRREREVDTTAGQTAWITENRKAVVSPNSISPFSASSAPIICQCQVR